MRRFGLSGACLALFVGVALTATAPAGADPHAPRISKCVRTGNTIVQWDTAWVDEHFGKGTDVTNVQFTWDRGRAGGQIVGNFAIAETPLLATRAVAAILTFSSGDQFTTDGLNCSNVANPHHLNRGAHLAKGRQR
jgi:hypothetical protein